MGGSGSNSSYFDPHRPLPEGALLLSPDLSLHKMLPPKAMKAAKSSGKKAMTKGALIKAIAGEFEIKAKQASKVVNSLAGIAAKEMTTVGQFTFPGLCRIKSRKKPATKATEKKMFGKVCLVKAQPARTIVKAFPVAALKRSV